MAKLDSNACAVDIDQMVDAYEKYKDVSPEKAGELINDLFEQVRYLSSGQRYILTVSSLCSIQLCSVVSTQTAHLWITALNPDCSGR